MILNIIKLIAIAIATFITSSTVIIVGIFDRRQFILEPFVKFWAKTILFIAGIKVEIEGLENIEKKKSYIVVANHLSMFDIPTTMAYLPVKLRMIAKKELSRVPVFGWGMLSLGHIFIDRQNRDKAVRSLDKAMERVKKRKISIMIYPEGTRSPDGEIKIFKKGAFVIAIKSELPILPVTISGSHEIMPKNSLRIKKGKIRLVVHPPVSSENKEISDRRELTNQIRDIIVDTFEKIKN